MSDTGQKTKSAKSGGGTESMWLAVVGALILGVTIIPLALGVIAYMVLRRYTNADKRDFRVLAGGSLIALFIDVVQGGDGLLQRYFTWLTHLFTGEDRFAVPVLSLMALGGLGCGILGILDGTRVAERMPDILRRRPKDRPSIIPTKRQKATSRLVAPPVDGLLCAQVKAVAGAQPGYRPFAIGHDPRGTPVFITEKEIETHMLCFGSTGSGKSISLQTIAAGLLGLGWNGMVLDMKEDTKAGGLRDWCHEYAMSHQLPYQELRLSDRNPKFWFNPLQGLGQDEARDAILSLVEFDDAYWSNINKKMLGQLLKLMYWANHADPQGCPEPTMFDVGKYLGTSSLAAATKKLRAVVAANVPGVASDEFSSLSSPTQDEQKSATGFGAKISQIFDTEAGRQALRAAGDRKMFDVTGAGLQYVGLDAQGKADLSRMVSSAVLQRISVDAAQRTTGQIEGAITRKFVICDEAATLDRTLLQSLLGKARSAGITIILCTQGPMDWIDKTGDDFARLAQNVNVALLGRCGDLLSAEKCADYIGTVDYMAWSMNHENGWQVNKGTGRKETDHTVTPQELRELQVGEWILKVGVPYRTTWVKVAMTPPNANAGPILALPAAGGTGGPPPNGETAPSSGGGSGPSNRVIRQPSD